MKKLLILQALVLSFTYALAQSADSVVFKSQADSASYAFGASIARDLMNRGVQELDYSLVAKAMNDVFNSRNVLVDEEKAQEVIYRFLTAIDKKKHEATIAEGTRFMEENSKKTGVVTLPSGLQYEVLRTSDGIKPKPTDEITVNYKGTLLDGRQFDSSYDRGEPVTLTLNQVIPGWTEGLQQMSVGSKYRFYIPYALAYGERGAGQDIPPYSNLIFEIELISAVGK
jgi:FKBP-type peptidyl-prolyl cis-trans isomerase